MNARTAAGLLLEIIERCPNLEGSNFLLMKATGQISSAKGYEVVIRTNIEAIDDNIRNVLNEIAWKNELEIAFGSESIMLFTRSKKF